MIRTVPSETKAHEPPLAQAKVVADMHASAELAESVAAVAIATNRKVIRRVAVGAIHASRRVVMGTSFGVPNPTHTHV